MGMLSHVSDDDDGSGQSRAGRVGGLGVATCAGCVNPWSNPRVSSGGMCARTC